MSQPRPAPTQVGVARRSGDSLAAASLGLGVVALAVGLVPPLFFVAWVLGVPAYLLGILGLRRARGNPPGRRTLATSGAVMGLVACGVGFVGYAIATDAFPSDLPISGGHGSVTRGVGSGWLGDGVAAGFVRRSGFEPRPGNAVANGRVPSAGELAAFRSAARVPYNGPVTGAFTGTTDEIIQWAAWKWGIDEDVLRAQAVVESSWVQSAVGDSGRSFGLFQIKSTLHEGTSPLSRESTAFNADYYGAQLRYCLDGHVTWLNTVERGRQYGPGDLWGCVGEWYAGRWYTPTAIGYIDEVKNTLSTQTWTQPGF